MTTQHLTSDPELLGSLGWEQICNGPRSAQCSCASHSARQPLPPPLSPPLSPCFPISRHHHEQRPAVRRLRIFRSYGDHPTGPEMFDDEFYMFPVHAETRLITLYEADTNEWFRIRLPHMTVGSFKERLAGPDRWRATITLQWRDNQGSLKSRVLDHDGAALFEEMRAGGDGVSLPPDAQRQIAFTM